MQTWSCSVSCRIFSYLHTWYPHRGRGKKKKPKHCKRQNGPESSCHTNCFLKTKGQTFFTNYEKQTSATLHGFLCPMHSLQSKCTREIFAHSLGCTLGHLYALVKTSFYRGTLLTLPDTFAFVLVTSAFQPSLPASNMVVAKCLKLIWNHSGIISGTHFSPLQGPQEGSEAVFWNFE